MARENTAVHVVLAPDGFYPLAFQGREAMVRVLSVESVCTFGAERRYRVRTAQGEFELGLRTDTGDWLVRRSPGWLSRARARWLNAPRYPLPSWRRRARRTAVAWAPLAIRPGGDHADRFALV